MLNLPATASAETLTPEEMKFKQELVSVIQQAATEAQLPVGLMGTLHSYLLRLPISQLKEMTRTLVVIADRLRPYL